MACLFKRCRFEFVVWTLDAHSLLIQSCELTLQRSRPTAMYHCPTGYDPNVHDDFHYSEISAAIFQDGTGDTDAKSSCLRDAEFDDKTIGKALSSGARRISGPKTSLLITLMKKVCCQFFTHTRTVRPVRILLERFKKRANLHKS